MERRLSAILAADVAGYSRLMGADETGTLQALQRHRAELIGPAIGTYHGRIVKTMGDGLLAEFASVVDAVRCAQEIQAGMNARNAEVADDHRVVFRIGVHLGDIIVEADDIYGDGVNIAARLEAIAEPGGITISRQVYDQVDGKLGLGFEELGPTTLKNIARPVEIFAVRERGNPATLVADLQQNIGFCRSRSGVRLAYATVGDGPPLVKAANWMNHLEYDWESPVWRHLLVDLASRHRLVRYDARGNGLSDWEVDTVSFDAFVDDLETVVDAARLDRFSLLGVSQGCAVSIAYAVRHPERVNRLVLYGGFALGNLRRSAEERENALATMTLMRQGWASDNPAIRQMFASRFFPDGSREQHDAFNDLQRIAISPENAYRYRGAVGDIDVRELLPKVSVPTLVLHAREDGIVPFEWGRDLAADIPGARFVALQGRNHLFLEHEPAAQRFHEEVRQFLAD